MYKLVIKVKQSSLTQSDSQEELKENEIRMDFQYDESSDQLYDFQQTIQAQDTLLMREIQYVSNHSAFNQQMQHQPTLPLKRSQALLILGIPSDISFTEFYEQQLQVQEREIVMIRIIEHIKMPSFYSLIVKFKSQTTADQLFNALNGRFFSEKNTEIMYTVFMSELIITSDDIKPITDDWLIPLPSCPLCLEKLDISVSGLLATILYEAFIESNQKHKWGNLIQECVVCRTQSQIHFDQKQIQQDDIKCNQCDNKENLWVCLVCSFIGCGRYFAGHAVSHYLQTNHGFSLELCSQRIWNYKGDNYVHRIIKTSLIQQQQQDNSMVVMSFPDSSMINQNSGNNQVDDRMLLEKINNTIREYNYLLTSQLEEQRSYYEDKIEKRVRALRQNQTIAQLDYCIDELIVVQKQKQNLVGEVQREINQQKKKNQQFLEKAQKAQKDLELAKEINQCLQSHIQENEQIQNEQEEQQKMKEKAQRNKQVSEVEKLKRQIEMKKETVATIKKEMEDLMQSL